jgi:hypothetical protein
VRETDLRVRWENLLKKQKLVNTLFLLNIQKMSSVLNDDLIGSSISQLPDIKKSIELKNSVDWVYKAVSRDTSGGK